MALEFIKKYSQPVVRRDSQVSNLFDLVTRRQWLTVSNLLTDNVDELRHPANNDSLLHVACKYQPPIQVIKKMVNVSPDLVSLINFDGQSPLHVAAQYGASPEVICFLCLSYPDTSEFQDIKGKTPLHLACESYITHYVQSPNRTPQEALLLTVKVLVRTSPTTVNLEDVDDMSAVEYLLDAEIDLKIVRVIQKASVKEWERRRAVIGKIVKDTVQEQYEEQKSNLQLHLKKQQKDYKIQQRKSTVALSA